MVCFSSTESFLLHMYRHTIVESFLLYKAYHTMVKSSVLIINSLPSIGNRFKKQKPCTIVQRLVLNPHAYQFLWAYGSSWRGMALLGTKELRVFLIHISNKWAIIDSPWNRLNSNLCYCDASRMTIINYVHVTIPFLLCMPGFLAINYVCYAAV